MKNKKGERGRGKGKGGELVLLTIRREWPKLYQDTYTKGKNRNYLNPGIFYAMFRYLPDGSAGCY